LSTLSYALGKVPAQSSVSSFRCVHPPLLPEVSSFRFIPRSRLLMAAPLL
jgi:hypothetical protein